MTADQSQPHGAIPKYVPPHLRGKVWDFRNEPGGNVSFQHPEATVGLPTEKARVTLTPEEYKLGFDSTYRLTHPDKAFGSAGYAPMQARPSDVLNKTNTAVANGISKAIDWGTSSQGKAVGTAGLLSALAGGVGGYMWAQHDGENPLKRALLMALLTGGLGAAGTAWTQSNHNRREAWLSKQSNADPVQVIVSILQSDPSVNQAHLQTIMTALNQARQSDREDLVRLLRTTAGAGAGALALRFLGAKGLLPMLAGGIIGGLLASSYQPPVKRNPLGQVLLNYLQK